MVRCAIFEENPSALDEDFSFRRFKIRVDLPVAHLPLTKTDDISRAEQRALMQ